ncbi:MULTISPECIES: type II toxin-antitoxin system VapC family toxin [unclassified Sinorhizobium]|uniref:type II toxin-antitoxin system VapC family toxin n=1 Tax=unclassified Sinorhizobium TaxID=2613772 RepID=UPI0035262AAA
MFVDTSAIIAILNLEPESEAFVEKIGAADHVITGAHVRLEACMNLTKKLGVEISTATELFDTFLLHAKITVLPTSDEVARLAVDAFASFGKGRHPAGLNFGDCLSYACAAHHRSPILFKGRDFGKTDLPLA